ncbi:acyl CoA-binding protein [Rhizoctonia solani AG-3 Rhs1AP]|uniref:Acyl CoA-binding protein n=2 Tax=Rhizoctonia solani AG-3 TaxID=1086053 RepID=A0A074RN24_9AGAM|nr:acyl CoA-binding protein [Rhizoctonia solani AG-3 Rhs1AP]KEP48496.1 acyl CoA-binding protein [Rhizoctonia solani 123E]
MSQAKFDKAVNIVQNIPKDGPVKPTQDQQLTFYKFYKQGTIGDVNTERPGMLDFTGKAKWDAWSSVKGVSKEEAQSKYVELLLGILTPSESEDAKKWIAEIEAA